MRLILKIFLIILPLISHAQQCDDCQVEYDGTSSVRNQGPNGQTTKYTEANSLNVSRNVTAEFPPRNNNPTSPVTPESLPTDATSSTTETNKAATPQTVTSSPTSTVTVKTSPQSTPTSEQPSSNDSQSTSTATNTQRSTEKATPATDTTASVTPPTAATPVTPVTLPPGSYPQPTYPYYPPPYPYYPPQPLPPNYYYPPPYPYYPPQPLPPNYYPPSYNPYYPYPPTSTPQSGSSETTNTPAITPSTVSDNPTTPTTATSGTSTPTSEGTTESSTVTESSTTPTSATPSSTTNESPTTSTTAPSSSSTPTSDSTTPATDTTSTTTEGPSPRTTPKSESSSTSAPADPDCGEINSYKIIANECDTYIECKDKVSKKRYCPDGLVFNPRIRWSDDPCVLPSEYKCTSGSMKQKVKATTLCPHRYGYFPMEGSDCSQYVVCTAGKPTIMNCTAGLVFNTEKSSCDWPANVPNCKPDVFKDFTCPEEETDIANSDEIFKYKYKNKCTQYVACQKGFPRLLSCDPSKYFSEIEQTCIDKAKVTGCED